MWTRNFNCVGPDFASSKIEGASEALKVASIDQSGGPFQQQTTRTILFGSLITSRAAAALAGLFAAWLAFRRQQQLGDMKVNFVSGSHELRAPSRRCG
jgi:hypothetical protein